MLPSLYLILSHLSSFLFWAVVFIFRLSISCIFFFHFLFNQRLTSSLKGAPHRLFLFLPRFLIYLFIFIYIFFSIMVPTLFFFFFFSLPVFVQAVSCCSALLTRFACFSGHLQHLWAISAILSESLWFFLINPGALAEMEQPAKRHRTNGECRYSEQEPASSKRPHPFLFILAVTDH